MTFTTPYHAFVALAQLDAFRVHVNREREKAVHHRDALQAELDSFMAERSTQQKVLQEERRAIAQKEHAIAQLRSRKQRSLDQRDRATSVRERQSLEAEAARIDEQIDREETAALTDLERFEERTALFDVQKAAFEKQCAEKKLHIASVEKSIENFIQEYEHAGRSRTPILDAVEPNLRERYESLRERDSLAAVPVVENRCGGCHTVLTATDLLSLRRHVIISCPECYKILYTPV